MSDRRTFAIISHPDAGKTTLTEKLLLTGGAMPLRFQHASLQVQRVCGEGSRSTFLTQNDTVGMSARDPVAFVRLKR